MSPRASRLRILPTKAESRAARQSPVEVTRPRASLPVATGPSVAAIDALAKLRTVPTSLSTAQLAVLPLAVRDGAFFSARIESARTIGTLRAGIENALAMPPDKAFTDRAHFVRDMRQKLGAAPGDTGKLTDITSERRLGLIYDFQLEQARERARFAMEAANPEIFDAYPCQELIRVEQREHPRKWEPRWLAAGGKLSKSSRMIARKDDPVWMALSRFGTPYPPFDFGSGMGTRAVSRAEAVEEGVITRNTIISPPQNAFNQAIEASTKNLSPEALDTITREFGPAVDFAEDGKIIFRTPGPDDYLADRNAHSTEYPATRLDALPKIDAQTPTKLQEQFEAQDGKTVATVDGPVTTSFSQHILHDKGPHDRKYRMPYLPAALETLRSPDGQIAAPDAKSMRPESIILHKKFTHPDTPSVNASVAVLIEPKAAIIARLQRTRDALQKHRDGLLIGFRRAEAQGAAHAIQKKHADLVRINAHIADIKAKIYSWEKSTATGEAWNYYPVTESAIISKEKGPGRPEPN